MKRQAITVPRRAILLSTMVGLLAPVEARAQRRRRIGALLVASPSQSSFAPIWAAFLDALRTLGWIEGHNLEIVVRATGGNQRTVTALADELLSAGVELVVAGDTPSAQALLQRTRTVPIIMASAADPVGAGLVSSLARPGGNVTGIGNEVSELAGKHIEFSREIVPGLRRIAVMYNPNNQGSMRSFQGYKAVAATVGIEVIPLPVSTSDELEAALAALARERPQVLSVHPAQPIILHSDRIAEFALKHGIATLGPRRISVREGHLLHYGSDTEEMARRAAYYVDRILRGAAPSDLPVEMVTFRLTINLATARALGVTIPASMLVRADEVIR